MILVVVFLLEFVLSTEPSRPRPLVRALAHISVFRMPACTDRPSQLGIRNGIWHDFDKYTELLFSEFWSLFWDSDNYLIFFPE